MRARERYPRIVTLSLYVGRLPLVVLRWSGLPELAHRDEAQTPSQRIAIALGTCAQKLNDVSFGRTKAEGLGLPA